MAPHNQQARELGMREQIRMRDELLREHIAAVLARLDAGDLDGADTVLRSVAFAELSASAAAIYHALAGVSRAVPIGALTTAARPALLLAVALGRREVIGRVDALAPLLLAAAAHVRRDRGASPAERARDLSLAALCLHLAMHDDEAVDICRRVNELVRDVETAGAADDLFVVAMSDVALILFATGHINDAGALWQRLRATALDPRLARLMQADWGCGVVGMLSGDTTQVSPLVRDILAAPPMIDSHAPVTCDAWWSMVAAARAWAMIDRNETNGLAELTSRTVAAATTPVVMSPIALTHAFALVLVGRARDALAFIDDQIESAGVAHVDSTWLCTVGAIAAAIVGDTTAHERFLAQVAPGDWRHALAAAYGAFVGGDMRAASLALVDPADATEGPRWQALVCTIYAAAHAQSGNVMMAREGLARLAIAADRYQLHGWFRILPQRGLDAVRPLLVEELAHLAADVPEHAVVEVATRVALTARETDILRMVGQGLTNGQIAARLYISPNTVKYHIAKMLKRLGVATREEAAQIATSGQPTR